MRQSNRQLLADRTPSPRDPCESRLTCHRVAMQDVFITLDFVERRATDSLVTLRLRDPRPDESVLERVNQEYEANHGIDLFGLGTPDSQDWAALQWAPRDDPDRLLIFTFMPRSATFAELVEVFGPVAHDPNGPIQLSVGAAGGFDSESIVSLPWPVRSIVRLGEKAVQLHDEATFADEREGVARWHDSGQIDEYLVALIREHGVRWDEKLFSRRFGVTNRDRGELLRAAGYERRYDKDRRDYAWFDTDPDTWTGGL